MTKMTRRSSNAFQDAVQVKRKSAPEQLINSLKNKSKNNNMDITPTMLEAIDFMGNDFQQSRKRIRKKPDILDMSILAEPNFSTSKSRFVGRTTVAPVLPKQRFQKPKITKSVKRKSQSPVATPRGGAGSTGKGIRTPPTGFKATVKKKRLAKPVSIPKTREPCPKSVNTVAVTKTKQPVVNKSVNSKNLAQKSTARMSTAQNKTSVRKPSSTSMSRFNKGAIFQKRKPTPQKSTENFEKAFKTLESLPERPKIASSSTSRFGGQKPIFQQIEVQPPELPSNMRPPIIQPNKPQPAKFNTTKIQPRATQKPTFNIPKTIPEANPNTVKNKTPNSAPNSTQNSAIKNVANILKPRQPPPVSNTSSSRFSGLNNIQFSAGKQSIPSNSSSRSRFSSAFKPHISLTKINEDINEAPTTNSAGQKNTVNRVLLNNQSLNSMNNTHSSNNTNLVNRNSLLNSSNNISKPSFATENIEIFANNTIFGQHSTCFLIFLYV